MGVTLANFKQSGKIPVGNDKLMIWRQTRETWPLILFETEVENVENDILPGLFLRERIISSTSAEDIACKE